VDLIRASKHNIEECLDGRVIGRSEERPSFDGLCPAMTQLKVRGSHHSLLRRHESTPYDFVLTRFLHANRGHFARKRSMRSLRRFAQRFIGSPQEIDLHLELRDLAVRLLQDVEGSL
jgi:hypothetical protein